MLTELSDVSMYLDQGAAYLDKGNNFVPSTVGEVVDQELLSDYLFQDDTTFFDSTTEKVNQLLEADSQFTSLESNSSSTNSIWENSHIQLTPHTSLSPTNSITDSTSPLPDHDLLQFDQLPLDSEDTVWEEAGSWRTSSSDPDWTPNTTSSSKRSSRQKSQHNSISVSQPTSAMASRKRRSTSSTTEAEIQIEIEQSTKRAKRCTANLSEEEKKSRRKELNRLAAQRCRNKRKGTAEYLEQEIDVLEKKNAELKERLEKLTSTKEELYDIIKFHFSNCHGGSVDAPVVVSI